MRRLTTLFVAGAVALSACSGAGGDPAEPEDVIEVFSVWRGSEAESFRAVLDEFEAATGYKTKYVGSAAFANRIQERVTEGDLPDVALFPQPSLIRRFAASGYLEPLAPNVLEVARDNFDADALEVGAINAFYYGFPWKIDVNSLVWYRPDVFEELGYRVPETLTEFAELVFEMHDSGETVWCLGMESFGSTGWVGTDWIEDILLRIQPVEVYDKWARGELDFDDFGVREAFYWWENVALQPGQTLGGSRAIISTPWETSNDPMFADDPQCLMHRQGSVYEDYLPDGTTIGPEGDVDVFVMPGHDAGDPPLLVSGQFAAAFTSNPGVDALLAYLATAESGEPWAERGGYLSPHLDFALEVPDDDFEVRLATILSEATVVRFDAADTMPLEVGLGTFWEGVVEFVATRNLDAAVATINSGYEQIDPLLRLDPGS